MRFEVTETVMLCALAWSVVRMAHGAKSCGAQEKRKPGGGNH